MSRQEETVLADKRKYRRQRTRLRTGKLTDLSDKFISECSIFDVSDGGIGMTVPEHLELPDEMFLYDDLQKTLAEIRVCWRGGKQVGVAYEIPPVPIKHFHAARLKALQFSRYAIDPEDEI